MEIKINLINMEDQHNLLKVASLTFKELITQKRCLQIIIIIKSLLQNIQVEIIVIT